MDDHFTLSRGLAPPAAGWGVYLARDRLRSLAGGAALPESPQGVAVLADIAGFTTLTEFLHERHGPRDGAEVLINYTNRVYGCLIGEVERYGGSVIDFAGDAILCWFDGADLAALRRAVAAALAMRDSAPACAGFAPDGWGESVALKISLAAGPARRMALGNPDIQRMDAIAGAAIDRLAELDRLVRPGVVVADRSCLGAVASELHWDPALPYVIASQPSPVAPLAATPVLPVPPATLLPWVPAPMRRHLGQARPALDLAEIRRAVVVFLQFGRRDYQHDPDAPHLLDAFVRHAQGVSARLGGHLLQLSLNDKGHYLYLVFGAPIAREHAVARATHAVTELLAPHPASAPFGALRGGIASGYARIGLCGAPQRQSYGVIGGAVNLAARLMAAARPGELLAPAALALATPGVAAQPRGVLHLKGLAAPCEVACLRADATQWAPPPDPPSAAAQRSGHTAALATLEGRLERLRQGVGDTVLVEGDPGMGKTVLLQSAAAHARTLGIDVVIVAASELEQTSLYAAWARLFAALFPSGAALEAAFAQLPGALAQAAPLVARALHRSARHDGGAYHMAPQLRAHLTRESLAALVTARARRAPLLLVLEDIQWLDSASLSLLVKLAAADAPLMLLVSARSNTHMLTPSTGTRLERIQLDPMPAPALLAIAAARLGAHGMTEDAAAFLLDKAGGNPFFAEELALAMRALGTLEVAHGLCRLGAARVLRSDTLPDSIEGILTARVDRLTPAQLHLAKLASAVGMRFDAHLLAELDAGLDDTTAADDAHDAHDAQRCARIGAQLAELAALDLLAPDDEAPGGYRFRHAIVRDVVYHLMLSAQRSRMHRWLALWYQRSHAAQPDAVLPIVAGHWTRVAADPAADDATLARAIDLLHRAALQAFHAHALGEMARHLQDALSLLARRPDGDATVCLETEFQSLLGYCLSTQRDYGDAAVEQAYRRGYALAQQADLPRTLGFPLYGLFSFYASRAEYAPARRLATQMHALVDAGGDRALSAFAHQSSGIVAFLGGDARDALACFERSSALVEGLAPDAFLGFATELPLFNGAWQVLALASAGRIDDARPVFAATLQAAAHAPHAQAFVLCFAMLPVWERDIDATLHYADALDVLSRRHGFDLYAAAARVYRGWALAERNGDPAGAALAATALPLLRVIKLNSFLPLFLGLVAQAHLAGGDAAGARTALAEAQTLTAEAGGNFYSAALARVQRLLPDWRAS